MSTNREQHELAARAAGLLLLWKTGHCKGGAFETPFIGDQPWRPKDDDGDALRLAVKLDMQVCIGYRRIDACIVGEDDGGIYRGSESKEGDPYAATRLAIFRAAVEIGKAMQASASPQTPAASPGAQA